MCDDGSISMEYKSAADRNATPAVKDDQYSAKFQYLSRGVYD